MKIAYLILAHDHPQILEILIRALAHKDVRIFVHVDAKVNLARFACCQAPGVVFSPVRYDIHWGGFNMIRATIALLGMAIQDPDVEYFRLLSGQDMPLCSQDDILQSLVVRRGVSYIDHRPLGLDRAQQRRATLYWFVDHVRIDHKIWSAFQEKIGIRRVPSCQIFYGEQWFCLHRTSVEYVLTQVRQDTALVRYFRHFRIPDESFFQTLLVHSPFSGTLINQKQTYALWRPSCSHPAVLTDADHDDVMHSPFMFARKFAPNQGQKILKSIERRIGRQL